MAFTRGRVFARSMMQLGARICLMQSNLRNAALAKNILLRLLLAASSGLTVSMSPESLSWLKYEQRLTLAAGLEIMKFELS